MLTRVKQVFLLALITSVFGPIIIAGVMYWAYMPIVGIVAMSVVMLLAATGGVIFLWGYYERTRANIDLTRLDVAAKRTHRVIQDEVLGPVVEELDPRTQQVTHKVLRMIKSPYSNGHHTVPTEEGVQTWNALMRVYEAKHGRARAIAQPAHAQLLPEATTDIVRVDVVQALTDSLVGLVAGASKAGKTNVLYHVIEGKRRRGRVFIATPHGHADDWPVGGKVVGTGMKYNEIFSFFSFVQSEIEKRYSLWSEDPNAHRGFDSWVVIVDEWSAIVERNQKRAAEFLRVMSTDARKAKIEVVFSGHSTLVDMMGLKGRSDLKDGFVIAKVHRNTVTGERRATVNFGDGQDDHPGILPGLHPDLPTVDTSRDTGDIVVNDVDVHSLMYNTSTDDANFVTEVTAAFDELSTDDKPFPSLRKIGKLLKERGITSSDLGAGGDGTRRLKDALIQAGVDYDAKEFAGGRVAGL